MIKIVTTKDKNPALRGIAQTVPIGAIRSPDIQNIIKNMSAALRNTKDGIGIAAPQIGAGLKIFIASEEALQERSADSPAPSKQKTNARKRQSDKNSRNKTKDSWKHFVFINPETVKIAKKKTADHEGCLSVPKIYGIVPRAEKITVRAYDEHGKIFQRGASGLFARLLQHEMDHLNGVLFIDKAKKLTKVEDDTPIE